MRPKLDLAVVAAVLAAGVLWVEHGHHLSLSTDAAGPPAPVATAAAAAGCADNDNAPYSASCLAFMGGDVPTQMRGWAVSLPSASATWSSAECPPSDSRPYPTGCIRYLSGWFWRPN